MSGMLPFFMPIMQVTWASNAFEEVEPKSCIRHSITRPGARFGLNVTALRLPQQSERA
jgi:hypothetical protein